MIKTVLKFIDYMELKYKISIPKSLKTFSVKSNSLKQKRYCESISA